MAHRQIGGGGPKGGRSVIEESRGMVNANHRGAVLLARCAQKSEVKECTNRRIISAKTRLETRISNLYPIYILSVPKSLPRVADV